jgi:ADP-ribose pyrophosphatase
MGNLSQVRKRSANTAQGYNNILINAQLTACRTTYLDPEGNERTWESAERLTRPKGCDIDGVGVAAILEDPANPNAEPKILLQKQWRPPINQTVIEFPAGLIDPNETPEACAVRELKEETGYVGEVFKDKTFDVSPVMFNGG